MTSSFPRLRKALEPDDPETHRALTELSSFLEGNTAQVRRGLRSDIERRGLVINHKLLSAFEGLQSHLDAVDAEVGSLCDACGSIASRLQDARACTEVLLAQTARLRTEATLNEQRCALATAFNSTFDLAPEEQVVLNAPAGRPSLDAFAPVTPSSCSALTPKLGGRHVHPGGTPA